MAIGTFLQTTTMTITLDLPPIIVEQLRARAHKSGQTLEAYLERLVEQQAQAKGVLAPAQESLTRRERALSDTYAVLSRRFESGQPDVAERHDEHQP
jgi:hypothetical protein